MVSLAQVFQAGLRHFHLSNTAYPPDKSNWAPYRTSADYSSWAEEKGFGFYIHIPFCKTRCRFCEYVTMQLPEAELVDAYLTALGSELAFWQSQIDFTGKILHGFDIGGGTPTILTTGQLEKLLLQVKPFINSLAKPADYEQSLETNVEIACTKLPLLRLLVSAGFTRISMGIQTISPRLLTELNRQYQAGHEYRQALENCRQAGFRKINLDLMYGLPGQSLTSWQQTLQLCISLGPEQLSLYETRYKDSQLQGRHNELDLQQLDNMYALAYEKLAAAGYRANYGSSAFSRQPADRGLSSYLRKRTTEFIPYLGLGIGSQAMTRKYLAYNYGKNSFDLTGYLDAVSRQQPVEFFYQLPPEESLAKFIAIAFYLGYLELAQLQQRMGIDFAALYREQLTFLQDHSLITLEDGKLFFTRQGFRQYHGIIPLFYAPEVREYLCGL